MIDLMPTVMNALLANSDLVNLLGGDHIYGYRAPDAAQYPRITIFELDNSGEGWADDQEVASQIRLQIDIWNTAGYNDIAEQVDKTMKSIGFQRTSSQDLFEMQTLIYHKAMRYATTWIQEG
ncbi:MAG: DUF3168 domain-containing protein [Alicyclobacillus sp.]|nr:DUF3168 domain-containing protein [Alicyclobacillus sp.]